VEERLQRLDLQELVRPWKEAIEAPLARDRVWLHGDLHPRNVLVQDGALAGLIDWGDVTAGDVATDLACAWMLFASARARTLFLEAYAPSEQVQARAAGWAVHFASGLIDSGEPRHVQIGLSAMRRLAGAEE